MLDAQAKQRLAEINERAKAHTSAIEQERADVLEAAHQRTVRGVEVFEDMDASDRRQLYHEAPELWRHYMGIRRTKAEKRLRGLA